jgi:foldase protein PrsA
MTFKDPGRSIGGAMLALAAATAMGGLYASAQQPKGSSPVGRQAQPKAGDTNAIVPRIAAIPVSPNDPVAIVNGEVITRGALADECVVREGERVLETLIARKLVDQAVRAKRIEVTAAEIDAEVEKAAWQFAKTTKEVWLRALAKDKGISPTQYKRDIIYPTLALRKLVAERVQVTAKDIKDAYEATYGEKLKCRMILVNTKREALEIWEELRRNPAAFEKLAQTRSKDEGTRAVGGLLPQFISRHAFPLNVSDAAFKDLVDGVVGDSDPLHKPKDGSISAVIEVSADSYVILRREGLIPAQKVDPNDKKVRDELQAMMFEARIKEEMGKEYERMMQTAKIENRLTGNVSTMVDGEPGRMDKDVKQMGQDTQMLRSVPVPGQRNPAAGGKISGKAVGVSDEDRQRIEEVKRDLSQPVSRQP